MRVITGSARGRKLLTPDNYDVRPTGDKVKESVFSIIQFDIEGRRVLDLFAGTGQLGIEALSRGARSAVFVDSSKKSLDIVKKNLKICNMDAEVYNDDACSFLRRTSGKFDLVFMDPPYDSDVYEPALDLICGIDLLNDNGIIVCESHSDRTMPELQGFKSKLYRYGKTKITVYKKDTAI